jgi:AraC-like DNA-binding protein
MVRTSTRAPRRLSSWGYFAGSRQCSRAFRAETGKSPAKAIESLRLDAARLMIEQSRHPVDVIATETGFGDQERMRRAFLRVFGHAPPARLKRWSLRPRLRRRSLIARVPATPPRSTPTQNAYSAGLMF